MLPELKPLRALQQEAVAPIAPASVKNAYNDYYAKDKNIALLNLLKEQERERNSLLEKYRKAQRHEVK